VAYWSVTCQAQEEVFIPEASTVLGFGANVFTIEIADIKSFLERLSMDGVLNARAVRLDDCEAVDEVAEAQQLIEQTPETLKLAQ
jgi:hypothetical protein